MSSIHWPHGKSGRRSLARAISTFSCKNMHGRGEAVMTDYDLRVAGGSLVTPSGVVQQDLLVAGGVVAAIVDVVAAAEIIVTHRKSPQPAGASCSQRDGAESPVNDSYSARQKLPSSDSGHSCGISMCFHSTT